jgi:TonB family protein
MRETPTDNSRREVASDTPRGPGNEPQAGGLPAEDSTGKSVAKPTIKRVTTEKPDPPVGGRPPAGGVVEGPVVAVAGDGASAAAQTLQEVQAVTPQAGERVEQKDEAPKEPDGEQKVLPPPPVVTPPELLTEVKRLPYPPILLGARQKGVVPVRLQVVLKGTVGVDGQVTDVMVERGAKEPLVDDVARKEFLKFRYKPAQRDGMPVAYAVSQTFEFEIPGR